MVGGRTLLGDDPRLTVKSPAGGLSASANYGLCSGALCPPVAPEQSKLLLPLVRR